MVRGRHSRAKPILLRAGRFAEFREALRLNKDDAKAHYNLGTALAAKGKIDDANSP